MAFEFPTPQEAFDWAWGLPAFQQQRALLEQFQSPETFQTLLSPYLKTAFAKIGRAGLPSSSFADRTVAATLAPIWAQQQMNALAGWQNLSRTIPAFMQSMWQPSQFLLSSGVYNPAEVGAVPAIPSPQTLPSPVPATRPPRLPARWKPWEYGGTR